MAGDKCRNSFSDFPLNLPLFHLGNALFWDGKPGEEREYTKYGVQSSRIMQRASVSRTEYEPKRKVQTNQWAAPTVPHLQLTSSHFKQQLV